MTCTRTPSQCLFRMVDWLIWERKALLSIRCGWDVLSSCRPFQKSIFYEPRSHMLSQCVWFWSVSKSPRHYRCYESFVSIDELTIRLPTWLFFVCRSFDDGGGNWRNIHSLNLRGPKCPKRKESPFSIGRFNYLAIIEVRNLPTSQSRWPSLPSNEGNKKRHAWMQIK